MAAIVHAFEANKRLADRAVAQVPDDKRQSALNPNTNLIAIIMQHVGGNLTKTGVSPPCAARASSFSRSP